MVDHVLVRWYHIQNHHRLSITFCGSLETWFPPFHAGRFRSQQIYKQEMKRGHILLDLDKLLMFGTAGSGKTCSLAALLGIAPPDIRRSTPLMKRPIEVVFIDVDGKKKWKIRTAEELQKKIAEVIRSRIPQQQPVAQSSGSPASPEQQPPHTTASQSAQPTPEKTSSSTSEAAGKSTASSEEKPRAREQQEAEGTPDSLLQLSVVVDEEYVSLVNNAPPSLLPILRLRQFLVLDSGGQPELLELMPVFLRGASRFAYVLKLNESLDERATIRYFKDGKLVWEYPAYLTNEGTLRLCVRTMRSLNNKNPDIPPAKMLFLATHRDKVPEKQLPGVLDTLHKRLREILLPQFKEQLIYCNTQKDFVFTLNAAKPEKEDKECADSVRECLNEVGEGGKKVPLRWYALYRKLLEVATGLGKKVLPRELCQQVAESMEVNDTSCGAALKFFDHLNMLFYFPKILPQLVFMEPQMLLDKVSELVEETYQMRQGKKGKAVSGEKLKFCDYAQVTEKFLGEFESHYEPPLFTPKELVTLLKGLLVFAEISEDVYFMPCLLQVVDWEVVEEHQVSGEKALALHFPDSGPLMGMFCSTVAYLMSSSNRHPCPWKVDEDEAGTPKCLHRNVIEFSVSDYAGYVCLIDHFTHFELHLHTAQ